ncbi:hypothetical protein FOC4_g10001291, partial [Fusarium odoratissimum]
CNGVRPRCDTCDKLGFDCSYEQQETSANLLVPKDIFAALEAKVKLLETNIEQHNGRLNLVESTLKSSGSLRQDAVLPPHHQSGNVVVNIDEIPENGAGQSMTDGMAVSFVDEQDCGFFGPSSNIALMRHILRAVDTKRTQQCNQTSLTPASEYSAYEGGLVRFRASGFRGNVRRTWLGLLLNMILAMATCTSCWEDSGSETTFEESDVYYRRAQELCHTQMFRGTTLETEEYIRLDLPKTLPVPMIMGRIIGSLYGSNLGCEDQSSDTATMTSMIQFGQELSDWQNSLPQHLGLRSVDNMPQDANEDVHDPLREKFRTILTLRYLNVQLLLHRPIFIRSLGTLLRESKTPYRNAGSINSMHANFDRVFVQVAENVIDIIYTILTRPDHGRHLIGAWWFTLYYAFSAALAIFGSLLISFDAEAGNAGRLESAKRYLGKTCEALLKLSDHNTLVLRCVKFVQQLLRIVNAWVDLNNESLGSYLTAEGGPINFDMESDLLSTMPTWETSTLGFGDELELGHFFASDSQRWFEQTQW